MWHHPLFPRNGWLILAILFVPTTVSHFDNLQPLSIDLTGCGLSKGCLRTPKSCTPPNCKHLLTWKDNGAIVEFEMAGLTNTVHAKNPWIAVGFSKDRFMPDTSVVDCLVNASSPGEISIQASYNKHHENEVLAPDSQIGLVPGSKSASFSDGQLVCKFSRFKSVNATEAQSHLVFNLTEDYFFLLGSGPTDDHGIKQRHLDIPHVSPRKLSVSENVNVNFDSTLVQGHISVMLITWMLVASTGVIMARHGTPLGAECRLLGQKVWFQIHRSCMVLTFLLVVTGVTLISIRVKATPLEQKRTHPILGLTTASLVLMNVVMAVFRPHPGTSRRPVFNVAHSCVGNSAHILAVVTMFFGVQEPMAQMPEMAKWLVLGFGCWKILVEIILILNNKYCKHDEQAPYQELIEPGDEITVLGNQGLLFIQVVISLYLVGCVAVTGTLLYHVFKG